MGWDEIAIEIERLMPSSLAARLDRDRPYDGQIHTDEGERGRQEVSGVTMRDLVDSPTSFDADVVIDAHQEHRKAQS